MLIPFNDVKSTDAQFGGKAYALAMLSQQGFQVPHGVILDRLPETEGEFNEIFNWWDELKNPQLAVRSSARGEDSGNYSFAGQNSTFLEIQSREELRTAIGKCFDSIKQSSSQAYGKHFLGEERDQSMNVLIQQMVHAKYSGVFFSKDPRGQSNQWVLEALDGLGENLVSGKKTPDFFCPDNKADWSKKLLDAHRIKEVSDLGEKVQDYLKYEVDMEWAVGDDDQLYLLQARPITTLNKEGVVDSKIIVAAELKRLKEKYSPNTVWDGQTFAEWTGYPSPITFDLWRQAFSPQHAFGNALARLGYMSFSHDKVGIKSSILDKVFGHAYVNLEELGTLFFGPIPYRIEPHPRPHLKFDFKKIDLTTILRTPQSIFKMLKVGWNLSTNRKKWLISCREELTTFKDKMDRPMETNIFKDWSDEAILTRFQKEYQNFATHALHWPFILIILTESTLNSLSAIIKSVLGKEETEKTLKQWMSIGLETATMEMNRYFKKACAYPEVRPFFMSRYGHRGPGELDLSHKRWIELQESAFYDLSVKEYEEHKETQLEKKMSVESEIEELNTFKRTIILQEWKLLKEMLELREQWKMELLKPYAHIRFLALEMGHRLGIGEDVFWLDGDDYATLTSLKTTNLSKEFKEKIIRRKQEKENMKPFSFPQIIALKSIENIVQKDPDNSKAQTFKGDALSPGIVEGVVLVVEDISTIDMNSIDKNTILVAEATDPGWTPLFMKVKGIITEKGGVLSHCAIVAREMKIPAVSGIYQCHKKLKNGQHVWVDGNNGRINLQ